MLETKYIQTPKNRPTYCMMDLTSAHYNSKTSGSILKDNFISGGSKPHHDDRDNILGSGKKQGRHSSAIGNGGLDGLPPVGYGANLSRDLASILPEKILEFPY